MNATIVQQPLTRSANSWSPRGPWGTAQPAVAGGRPVAIFIDTLEKEVRVRVVFANGRAAKRYFESIEEAFAFTESSELRRIPAHVDGNPTGPLS